MNILFIDDNSTIQKVNLIMLKKFEYLSLEDKIFFRNTKRLEKNDLEWLLKKCEVIICDYDLGEAEPNGLDFFSQIDDVFKGLKILLTANDTYLLKNIMETKKEIKYVIKSKTFSSQQKTTRELGNLILHHRHKI